MKVLGGDLGAAGAAVLVEEIDGVRVHQTWIWEFTGDMTERLNALLNFLLELREEVQPDVAICERPFGRGQAATRSQHGMFGVWAAVWGGCAAVVDEQNSVIKKHATGKGNASKEEMMDMAQLMGYDAETEHAADAFLAAIYAIETMEVTNV